MLEDRWVQGVSNQSTYFINGDTICLKCDNYLQFRQVNGETLNYHYNSPCETVLAVHPIHPTFALAETNTDCGKVVLINYSSFKDKTIGKVPNTQVLHLAFSYKSLLACISSIRNNTLTIWDFVKSTQLIESSLNFICPEIFGFCPVNENVLVGATERFIYSWSLEPYGEDFHLTCRVIISPHQDASLGFYDEPPDDSSLELIEAEENPNEHSSMKEVVSGMLRDGAEEYQNYGDNSRRMKCQSLTWTREGFAIFGCRNGYLFMVDLASMAIGIIHNDPDGLREANASSLVYTLDGILCGGADGRLRLMKVQDSEDKISSIALVAPTSLTIHNLTSNFLNAVNSFVQSQVVLVDENIFPALQGTQNEILNLTASANFHYFGVLRSSGLIQILQWDAEIPKMSCCSLHCIDFLRSNASFFTGLCSVIIGNEAYYVTSNISGQVVLWIAATGEQVFCLEFTSPATCIEAVPGLPLTAIGFQDGSLRVVSWIDSRKPQVVSSLQIFRSQIHRIFIDNKGDVMLVAGSDPNIFLVSCEPRNDFQPLGFIVHDSRIDSVTFARGPKNRIHCLILDSRKKGERFTGVTHFTLAEEILDDPTAYHYPNSFQLRDESISLVSFKILLELSGAYLIVTDPHANKLSKRRRKDSSEKTTGEVGSSSDREADNTVNVDDDTLVEEEGTEVADREEENGSPVPRTILYSITSGGSDSAVLVMVDLTKEIADQTSTYRQYARGGLLRRSNSQNRDFTSHLQPLLQARSNARRSLLGAVSNDVLSYRASRASVNLHHLVRMRKEDRKDKRPKKEIKPTVTGVESFHVMDISFFCTSITLCSTHISGIVIAKTQAGVFYFLKLNEKTASVLGVFHLTESTDDPIEVAVTGDFETFAIAKRQGTCCAIDMRGQLPGISEDALRSEDIGGDPKRTTLISRYFGEANYNNGSMVDESHQELVSEDNGFQTIKIGLTTSARTWVEEQFEKQQEIDRQNLSGTRKRIAEEFGQIKKELEKMALTNYQLTDLQKVAISEFELDYEERNSILEETQNILQEKKAKSDRDDRIKEFTHGVIKSLCWDVLEVKGRNVFGCELSLDVPNYPIYRRSPESIRALNQAKIRRRIEISTSHFCKQECDRVFKKISTSESDKGSYEELGEEEATHSGTTDHLGSVAGEFGIDPKLLYRQMELFTNDQKLTQIVLIQDLMLEMKADFNEEFSRQLERKRHNLDLIQQKMCKLNEILPKLDPGAKPLSAERYRLHPLESIESVLECTDDEVDVERYRSPEEVAAEEAAAHEIAERLRLEKLDNWRERGLEDMMGGVLEVRKEDELKKDIPVPYFIKVGKSEVDMSSEEKKIYRQYLQACKELSEEREKYRKYLEGELKKNEIAIAEAKKQIDTDIENLFQTYLRYEIGLNIEDVKIWKLRASIQQAREFHAESRLYGQLKTLIEAKTDKLGAIIQQTKDLIEKYQEDMELIGVEDKMIERGFRKEFHDVHGPMYDVIHKSFKRRPKKLVLVFRLHYDENQRSSGWEETQGGTLESPNPYTDALMRSLPLEAEWLAMRQALNGYDEMSRMNDYNIDSNVWERLYKARMKKAWKEMELKMATNRLKDTTAFLQRREREHSEVAQELERVEAARSELKARLYRHMTNLEVNIVMPQGQVEAEVPPGRLVENFNTCVLINRRQVEDLNTQVTQLSNEKINHMELIKSYKRRFKMLEWDLREMLMRYEDLMDRQKQITNFTITREIQRYLQNRDYESMVSAELNDSGRTYAELKRNHQKHMLKMKQRIEYFKEKQVGKLKKQNEELLRNLEEMNIQVLQARHIYEHTPHRTSDFLRAESCYKSLLRKSNLEKLALSQSNELNSLREELKQLHKKSFPSLSL